MSGLPGPKRGAEDCFKEVYIYEAGDSLHRMVKTLVITTFDYETCFASKGKIIKLRQK